MANTKSINLVAASSQYLSITDASQTGLDGMSSLSIMGRMKMPSFGTYVIASKWVDNTSSESAYYLNVTQTTMKFAIKGSSLDSVSSSHSLSVDTWYHFAATFNGSTGDMSIYLNGVKTSTSKTTTNTAIPDVSTEFAIGRLRPAVWHYNGKIDELGVYNTALSAATILADYEDDICRNSGESGIVAGWNFEDDLLDVTSNNNDLTNNNSATYSTDVPFATCGGSPPVTATDDAIFFGCNF